MVMPRFEHEYTLGVDIGTNDPKENKKMASKLSRQLAQITRSRPTRSTFKKDRDRSLIGKARIKARKLENKS